MKKIAIILLSMMFIGFLTNVVFGQSTLKTYRIYVIDETDTPMPGALIYRWLVPSHAMTTDLDGIALFETFVGSDVGVQYLGYVNMKFKAGNSKDYTIVMKPDDGLYYVVPMAADQFIQLKKASKVPVSFLLQSLGAEVKSMSN